MSHERTHFRRNYDQIDGGRHPKEFHWEKNKNRKGIGSGWGWKHGGPLSRSRRLNILYKLPQEMDLPEALEE